MGLYDVVTKEAQQRKLLYAFNKHLSSFLSNKYGEHIEIDSNFRIITNEIYPEVLIKFDLPTELFKLTNKIDVHWEVVKNHRNICGDKKSRNSFVLGQIQYNCSTVYISGLNVCDCFKRNGIANSILDFVENYTENELNYTKIFCTTSSTQKPMSLLLLKRDYTNIGSNIRNKNIGRHIVYMWEKVFSKATYIHHKINKPEDL